MGRTRTGTDIHVSLFDGMADWMTVPSCFGSMGGVGAEDGRGLRHPSIAPYETFVTLDGHDILIAIQNEREWAVFRARDTWAAELDKGKWIRKSSERVANHDRPMPTFKPSSASVFGRDGGVPQTVLPLEPSTRWKIYPRIRLATYSRRDAKGVAWLRVPRRDGGLGA